MNVWVSQKQNPLSWSDSEQAIRGVVVEEVLRNRVKAAEDRLRAAGRYFMSKKKKRRLERGLREAVAALVAYQLSKD